MFVTFVSFAISFQLRVLQSSCKTILALALNLFLYFVQVAHFREKSGFTQISTCTWKALFGFSSLLCHIVIVFILIKMAEKRFF